MGFLFHTEVAHLFCFLTFVVTLHVYIYISMSAYTLINKYLTGYYVLVFYNNFLLNSIISSHVMAQTKRVLTQKRNITTRRLLVKCHGDTESALETLCNLLKFSTHMVSLFMFMMEVMHEAAFSSRCNVITPDITIYGVVEFSTSDERKILRNAGKLYGSQLVLFQVHIRCWLFGSRSNYSVLVFTQEQ